MKRQVFTIWRKKNSLILDNLLVMLIDLMMLDLVMMKKMKMVSEYYFLGKYYWFIYTVGLYQYQGRSRQFLSGPVFKIVEKYI